MKSISFQKIKPLISVICFLILIYVVFQSLTYMMRGNNGDTIRGLYTEPENTIDVLCVGPSSVYEYFTPLKAYHDYGFTSYDFGAGGIDAELYPYLIKEALKTQSPQVILADVRKLLSAEHDEEIGAYFRNGSDAMKLSLNRIEGIHYFCEKNNIPDKNALNTYLDIIFYHANYDRLGEKNTWGYIDNVEPDKKKGSITPRPYVHFYDTPDADTDEVSELSKMTTDILTDIINVCKDNGIELVLTASPYIINEKLQKELNAMGAFAEENGIPFLDFNGKYNLIPVDFHCDFRNSRHFNVLGMEKYTEFICQYLDEKYNLPDHRLDESYSGWNENADWYVEIFQEKKEECLKKVKEIEASSSKINALKATKSITSWSSLSRDENYTVFVVGDNTNNWELNDYDAQALEYIGMNKTIMQSDGFVGTYKADIFDYVIDDIKEGEAGDRTDLGDGEKIAYSLRNEDDPVIQIGDEEYRCSSNNECIYLILMNNYQLQIEDILVITSNNGELVLNHIENK